MNQPLESMKSMESIPSDEKLSHSKVSKIRQKLTRGITKQSRLQKRQQWNMDYGWGGRRFGKRSARQNSIKDVNSPIG